MKARASRYTSSAKETSELLESDDELPDIYDDILDIPAYQNDSRFERLEHTDFQWLQQGDARNQSELMKESSLQEETINKIFLQQQQSSLDKETCLEEILSKETTEVKKNKKKILISKGVLSRRDLFFIKSIEEYSTDTTLLWFIDFLIHKAVQPLQRSCLVADITANYYTKEPSSDFNFKYYLKLVVK